MTDETTTTDQPMDRAEFLAALEVLGQDKTSIARNLGRSRRTVQRWTYPDGDERRTEIPQPVATLIRHWVRRTLERRTP